MRKSGIEKPNRLDLKVANNLLTLAPIFTDFRDEKPSPPAKNWAEAAHSDWLIRGFRASLTDTVAWCNHKASLGDPENCLRNIVPNYELLGDRDNQIKSIYKKRAGLLRDANLYPSKPVSDLQGGRLVVFWPDGTLSDGAAQQETNGFFNGDNFPPTDTWVCYVHEFYDVHLSWLTNPTDQLRQAMMAMTDGYLVSWVPPAFIPMVDRGINVIPEECVVWLDSAEGPFKRLLKQYGFIS